MSNRLVTEFHRQCEALDITATLIRVGKHRIYELTNALGQTMRYQMHQGSQVKTGCAERNNLAVLRRFSKGLNNA